jgi:mRNA-degrading endonuclease RelE of RelBE toxin-antitoxin system
MTEDAENEAASLPVVIKARIREIVVRLGQWPNVSGAKRLKGQLSGQRRMRTGDYRVQFVVGREEIVIVKIGHRHRFYGE